MMSPISFSVPLKGILKDSQQSPYQVGWSSFLTFGWFEEGDGKSGKTVTINPKLQIIEIPSRNPIPEIPEIDSSSDPE